MCNDPPSLYAFLVSMPKGSGLHSHVSGAVYAESYLRAAAMDGLCANPRTGAMVAADASAGCGDNVPAARAETDTTLCNALIDSLSMRNFVAGRETGHDHFFAACGKAGPATDERRGEFLAEVTQRAADQNALRIRRGLSLDLRRRWRRRPANGIPPGSWWICGTTAGAIRA